MTDATNAKQSLTWAKTAPRFLKSRAQGGRGPAAQPSTEPSIARRGRATAIGSRRFAAFATARGPASPAPGFSGSRPEDQTASIGAFSDHAIT